MPYAARRTPRRSSLPCASRRSRIARVVTALLPLVATIGAAPTAAPAATIAPSPTPVPTQITTPGTPGMYHVYSCRTPSGTPAPLDGWVVGPDVTALGADLWCDQDNAFGPRASVETGTGRAAIEWMTPSADLVPVSVVLRRAVRSFIDPITTPNANGSATLTTRFLTSYLYNGMVVPTISEPFRERSDGYSAKTSTIGSPWDPSAANNLLAIDGIPTAREVRPLRIEAQCSPEGSPSCDAKYLVFSADFRIKDAIAPTVDTASGSLIDAIAGSATARGSLGFIAAAADGGSGVRRARVEVDGKVVTTASLESVLPTCRAQTAADGLPGYTLIRPCPSGSTLAGQLDTAPLSDGEHAVRVLVDDAAGNSVVAAAGALLVRNSDQIGAGSPLALRGAANGSPATDAGVLRVAWPSTARRASTRPSKVRRCKSASYAAKHPLTCKGRPADSAVTSPFSPSRVATAQLALTTADGQPISGATVELQATPAAVGAAPTALPSVTTGPDGTATFSVPLSGGSRTLEARWRARVADTRPAATGTATLAVAASTTLDGPGWVGRGARVTFSGRLDGRAGSPAKVPVRLEVRDRGRWKTFATSSTDGDGNWRARLRFAQTPGTYVVRAKVGTTTTYPYAAGASPRSVRVRVR